MIYKNNEHHGHMYIKKEKKKRTDTKDKSSTIVSRKCGS